jgi:hypothetical protein
MNYYSTMKKESNASVRGHPYNPGRLGLEY